jgi:hypothetical protein
MMMMKMNHPRRMDSSTESRAIRDARRDGISSFIIGEKRKGRIFLDVI